MMRVLVTGAGGFIGQHLTAFLRREGYWVRGVDLQSPRFGLSNANEFELLDLRSWPDCLRATKDVDEVYALAADPASDNDKTSSSATALTNDSIINSQSIEAARQNGVGRYLYASSEHIYPQWRRTGAGPLREGDAMDAAERDPKGWANLLSERLCLHYGESCGIETRIVRMHDVYGPGAIWLGGNEASVTALCRKIVAAELEGLDEIEITTGGLSKGSHLYIDDCVAGLLKIMRSRCRIPVNLDHPKMLSTIELADLIARVAGADVELGVLASSEDSHCCCHFDTTVLQQTIQWKPETTMEEGIKRTYQRVAEQVRELASEFSFGVAHFPCSRQKNSKCT